MAEENRNIMDAVSEWWNSDEPKKADKKPAQAPVAPAQNLNIMDLFTMGSVAAAGAALPVAAPVAAAVAAVKPPTPPVRPAAPAAAKPVPAMLDDASVKKALNEYLAVLPPQNQEFVKTQVKPLLDNLKGKPYANQVQILAAMNKELETTQPDSKKTVAERDGDAYKEEIATMILYRARRIQMGVPLSPLKPVKNPDGTITYPEIAAMDKAEKTYAAYTAAVSKTAHPAAPAAATVAAEKPLAPVDLQGKGYDAVTQALNETTNGGKHIYTVEIKGYLTEARVAAGEDGKRITEKTIGGLVNAYTKSTDPKQQAALLGAIIAAERVVELDGRRENKEPKTPAMTQAEVVRRAKVWAEKYPPGSAAEGKQDAPETPETNQSDKGTDKAPGKNEAGCWVHEHQDHVKFIDAHVQFALEAVLRQNSALTFDRNTGAQNSCNFDKGDGFKGMDGKRGKYTNNALDWFRSLKPEYKNMPEKELFQKIIEEASTLQPYKDALAKEAAVKAAPVITTPVAAASYDSAKALDQANKFIAAIGKQGDQGTILEDGKILSGEAQMVQNGLVALKATLPQKQEPVSKDLADKVNGALAAIAAGGVTEADATSGQTIKDIRTAVSKTK